MSDEKTIRISASVEHHAMQARSTVFPFDPPWVEATEQEKDRWKKTVRPLIELCDDTETRLRAALLANEKQAAAMSQIAAATNADGRHLVAVLERAEAAEAEAKRLTETNEHLGNLLRSAGRDLAAQQAQMDELRREIGDLTCEVTRQRARGDLYAAGIDALIRRYIEQQANASRRGDG
jgi:hypothetical protein